MTAMTRIARHERLLSRMADANEADLDLALMLGNTTPEELTDAVMACTGCANPDACEHHLNHGHIGVPAFCRNARLIDRLAKTGRS